MDSSLSSTLTTTRPAQTSTQRTTTTDYDTFLRMLTTQLRYQDPLDPVDSTDYAAQLATFSAVEQQVETNALLGRLAQRFDLLGMAQLSGWVGQEALTTAPVQFDGAPVTLRPEVAPGADTAVLVVKDSAGNILSRETLPTDGQPYQWLGGDATGNPLPEGRYTLTLESLADDEVVATSAVAAYAPITEALRGENGIMLRLNGGIQVSADEIRALRIP